MLCILIIKLTHKSSLKNPNKCRLIDATVTRENQYDILLLLLLLLLLLEPTQMNFK